MACACCVYNTFVTCNINLYKLPCSTLECACSVQRTYIHLPAISIKSLSTAELQACFFFIHVTCKDYIFIDMTSEMCLVIFMVC